MKFHPTVYHQSPLLSGCKIPGLPFWIYVLLELAVITTWASGCVFPSYTLNNVNGTTDFRDWRGQIKAQNRETNLKYVFHSDIMEVISSNARIKPYSRVCIQAYTDDKYLVAHEEKGQTRGRYTCMQILKRSNSVLQIREAELSERMGRNLCGENKLKLDGWIIIDTKTILSQRQDCSLVGGFNIQVYDKTLNKGVCDGYVGETRLESECLPGEGLSFYYRQSSCVPDGLYMYPNQRTYCLANWEDGKYKFILLKHNKMNYMWVLRYPKIIDTGRTFTANLMKDLYAATEDIVTKTYNYLSISVSRQSPKLMDTLCFDDYEICSTLKDPCSYSEEIAKTCAKTCGFCTDLVPSSCQFSLPVNGSWTDAHHVNKGPIVQINSSSIDIAGQETLHCVDWGERSRSSRATNEESPTGVTPTVHNQIYEQMLVTVSDNGCRPRFSCGKFTRLPSNVMFMQLTQTRLWPLVENKEDPYTCKDFIYTNNKDIDKNPYRTRHQHLFITDHINNSIQCDLSNFEYFAVLFKDGIRCSGHLTQNPNKDSVQLSFPECSVQRLRHKFTCLEYSKYPPENDMILVTKSHENTPKVHCWLFPKRPDNIFHIIESEQCNSMMKRKIKKGRLRPIATFTIDPSRGAVATDKTITVLDSNILKHLPVNKTSLAVGDTPEVVIGHTSTSVSTRASTTTIPTRRETESIEEAEVNHTVDGNDTLASDAGNSEKSPVVVAAVVVTLILMQVPLLCKCKC